MHQLQSNFVCFEQPERFNNLHETVTVSEIRSVSWLVFQKPTDKSSLLWSEQETKYVISIWEDEEMKPARNTQPRVFVKTCDVRGVLSEADESTDSSCYW